jgi:pSer/pThr/pTyr-binding forkhead associated (FHA) protein
VITLDESRVVIRDLQSRNGTYVNGQRLDGERELKMGDVLKVGKLEFEVLIDHGLGGTKKPEVRDVKEAAVRVATVKEGVAKEETAITDWLEEADAVDRERRLTDPETRQYKLDETDRVALERPAASETVGGAESDTADDTKIDPGKDKDSDKDKGKDKDKEKDKKKKVYGKLPTKQGPQSKDSRDAAAQVLRDFFNRR